MASQQIACNLWLSVMPAVTARAAAAAGGGSSGLRNTDCVLLAQTLCTLMMSISSAEFTEPPSPLVHRTIACNLQKHRYTHLSAFNNSARQL